MSDFPKIHTVTGKFMFLPRDHVHAYVVEMENSVVVIDTTLALSSAADVRRLADSTGKPIEAVLLTHGHPDHYTGLVKFDDLPCLASWGCLEFARAEDIVKSPTAKMYLGDDYPNERAFPTDMVKDGDRFTFGGIEFTFTDLGPGESDSDGMWSFTKDGVRAAFVGDAVANRTHCFFRDGHTSEWLRILDRLERDFANCDTLLYVGHGSTPSTLEAIQWQRGYIQTFVTAMQALEDKSAPVSRESQEKIIAAMKHYLPSDATLFLLDYEMDVFMGRYFGFEVAAAH
ncbi:MAG: MBL fold metallo-hydrolase [Anaerolineae bacterium]|nr:MBL fold metallo-hydrolase [Anaerolineae bacterium]